MFALVVDPGFFRSIPQYQAAVDDLFTTIKRAPPAEGTRGALIPGEPDSALKNVRQKEGVPIDDNTWKEICELAARCQVPADL